MAFTMTRHQLLLKQAHGWSCCQCTHLGPAPSVPNYSLIITNPVLDV